LSEHRAATAAWAPRCFALLGKNAVAFSDKQRLRGNNVMWG